MSEYYVLSHRQYYELNMGRQSFHGICSGCNFDFIFPHCVVPHPLLDFFFFLRVIVSISQGGRATKCSGFILALCDSPDGQKEGMRRKEGKKIVYNGSQSHKFS